MDVKPLRGVKATRPLMVLKNYLNPLDQSHPVVLSRASNGIGALI